MPRKRRFPAPQKVGGRHSDPADQVRRGVDRIRAALKAETNPQERANLRVQLRRADAEWRTRMANRG